LDYLFNTELGKNGLTEYISLLLLCWYTTFIFTFIV
jgi:hypothetical protein